MGGVTEDAVDRRPVARRCQATARPPSPSSSAPAAATGRTSRSPPGPLDLRSTCSDGITRVVLEGDGESFTLGDVEFEFSSAA